MKGFELGEGKEEEFEIENLLGEETLEAFELELECEARLSEFLLKLLVLSSCGNSFLGSVKVEEVVVDVEVEVEVGAAVDVDD